jgi:hypothetical protein
MLHDHLFGSFSSDDHYGDRHHIFVQVIMTVSTPTIKNTSSTMTTTMTMTTTSVFTTTSSALT